jgi:hypothetical protein
VRPDQLGDALVPNARNSRAASTFTASFVGFGSVPALADPGVTACRAARSAARYRSRLPRRRTALNCEQTRCTGAETGVDSVSISSRSWSVSCVMTAASIGASRDGG